MDEAVSSAEFFTLQSLAAKLRRNAGGMHLNRQVKIDHAAQANSFRSSRVRSSGKQSSASAALLAQHVGLGGSTSPAHFGGQVHVRPAPSLPGPSRSSGLPSGPMALRPGVRFPSSPIREGQYRPPTGPGPSHRPDNDRHGVEYRSHDPYIYAGYTWLNSFGYGFPVAYGGLPYDNGQEDTGGPQPGPQQADYGDQPPADYAPEPPAPQVADNAPLTFRPAYQGQADNAPVSAQPATTLIFKDGRPPVRFITTHLPPTRSMP